LGSTDLGLDRSWGRQISGSPVLGDNRSPGHQISEEQAKTHIGSVKTEWYKQLRSRNKNIFLARRNTDLAQFYTEWLEREPAAFPPKKFCPPKMSNENPHVSSVSLEQAKSNV
jgi:hypothetical protein